MFVYEKKLQYPIRIKNSNPKLAAAIIYQYGGPDGELGASLRYLSQRYSMPYPELKGLLTDIGTRTPKSSSIEASSGFDFSEELDFEFDFFPFFFFISGFSSLSGESCFFKFLSCSRTKLHLWGRKFSRTSIRLSGKITM